MPASPLGKPPWLTKRLRLGREFQAMEGALAAQELHTICQEACCPNMGECFSRGVATFLILGDVCTRNCRFCAVKHGRPIPVDAEEPLRLARETNRLGLRFVVITSVTRDDLPDGGAGHFADTILTLRRECEAVGVEVLIPDFQGCAGALRRVVEAAPQVLNHNVETVPRLYPQVRPEADFARSLRVLRKAKQLAPGLVTKSGFMVGLGERPQEVRDVMARLRDAGCDLLTIGQYLCPSTRHHPVVAYIPPDEFEKYRAAAQDMGFKGVKAGPFVRSSYRAEDLYQKAIL